MIITKKAFRYASQLLQRCSRRLCMLLSEEHRQQALETILSTLLWAIEWKIFKTILKLWKLCHKNEAMVFAEVSLAHQNNVLTSVTDAIYADNMHYLLRQSQRRRPVLPCWCEEASLILHQKRDIVSLSYAIHYNEAGGSMLLWRYTWRVLQSRNGNE